MLLSSAVWQQLCQWWIRSCSQKSKHTPTFPTHFYALRASLQLLLYIFIFFSPGDFFPSHCCDAAVGGWPLWLRQEWWHTPEWVTAGTVLLGGFWFSVLIGQWKQNKNTLSGLFQNKVNPKTCGCREGLYLFIYLFFYVLAYLLAYLKNSNKYYMMDKI